MTESASEPVGSVSEEAFKLFRALSSSSAEPKSDEPHVCTATWCPVCQVVGLVRDNPDAIAQVSASAAAFAKSLRDLVDSAKPTPPEDEEA
ncbi:hypothetical protein [Aeromicrobium sp.]|uniref:hypothetical protein n=1 Tax=Aeromicrobium sp. TaxID=1871063 RepID=UPI002FC85CED